MERRCVCRARAGHGRKGRVLLLELRVETEIVGGASVVLHVGGVARKAGVVAHHVLHAGRLHVELEILVAVGVSEVHHGQAAALGGHVHGLVAVVAVGVDGHAPAPDVFCLVVLANNLHTRSAGASGRGRQARLAWSRLWPWVMLMSSKAPMSFSMLSIMLGLLEGKPRIG